MNEGVLPRLASLIVQHVSLRDFRSYASLELELDAGLVLVTGANGVGKTNLLEALHVGSQGFSPRTRAETQLVRFGAATARVRLAGDEGAAAMETDVTIQPGQPKRLCVNGAALTSADELRARVSALVFLPDRLVVAKGSPAVRRAYFDRLLGRVFPARLSLPSEYARALAQRNEALRRVRGGASTRAALAPWTERLAALGSELEAARVELVGLLAPRFSDRARALGLERPELRYDARPVTADLLEARVEGDLARGVTSAGPHLRDFSLLADERDLRNFGSQGEQRIAVLALVLAEASLVVDRRGTAPLLLLDDVLSELDPERRSLLLASLPDGVQTVVTATTRDALPAGAVDPALVVRVRPGEARPA